MSEKDVNYYSNALYQHHWTQLEEKRKAAESKTCQGKRGLLKVQEQD